MKIQLFNFDSDQIRVICDENGNPWFVAKDLCDVLEHSNHSKALSDLVDDEDRMKLSIPTKGGNQKLVLVNESGMYSLIFGSRLQSAKVFKRWVTKDVLPTIRKTGSYSFANMLLPAPTTWQKTFPDEFMRQVCRLYNQPFDRKLGTPSYVGKFINKYIYGGLDKNMSKALKDARINYAKSEGVDTEQIDQVAFLHQFLNTDGKESLIAHISTITAFASISTSIETFDAYFKRAFENKNQLGLRL